MQTYTTTTVIGQWVSQTLDSYDLSQTAKPVLPGLILYQYKLHEVVLPSIKPDNDMLGEVMLSQLYAEFAQEDRELANVGLADYARSLALEDGVE